mmetsp:Transcript_26301/g.52445  ORF Transcript_26301/g.52445 Transcript_26301/m.52445 type:complete len:96 (+) Transcript_26301:204-491(+)
MFLAALHLFIHNLRDSLHTCLRSNICSTSSTCDNSSTSNTCNNSNTCNICNYSSNSNSINISSRPQRRRLSTSSNSNTIRLLRPRPRGALAWALA